MSLRCDEASRAAPVAGHVMLAMATRAGLPPLSADRARTDITAALGDCEGPVEVAWGVEEGRVFARISAPSQQVERLAGSLSDHEPTIAPNQIELWFARAGLRPV